MRKKSTQSVAALLLSPEYPVFSNTFHQTACLRFEISACLLWAPDSRQGQGRRCCFHCARSIRRLSKEAGLSSSMVGVKNQAILCSYVAFAFPAGRHGEPNSCQKTPSSLAMLAASSQIATWLNESSQGSRYALPSSVIPHRPHHLQASGEEEEKQLDKFLERCVYKPGQYDQAVRYILQHPHLIILTLSPGRLPGAQQLHQRNVDRAEEVRLAEDAQGILHGPASERL